MYITQGLHRHIQARPDGTAIIFNDQVTTFGQLGDRVARLAGALKKLGVACGDRVAMLSFNSARYIEYFLAVPWANAVVNPANFRWSASEIAYSLDDSGTAVMIVDDEHKQVAEKVRAESKSLRTLIYAGDGETPEGMLNYEELIACNDPIEDARRGGDSLLGIFYTGGTTGFPKGVMVSHSSVAFNVMSSLIHGRNGPGAVFLHSMPMFHMSDFTAMVMLFISGGEHVVMQSFRPRQVLEAIARYGVSDVMLAPTMIQMLLDYRDANPEAQALDLSSLRRITYGASPITPTQLDRTRAVFPAVGFSQGYGMTELCPVATVLAPAHHSPEYQENGKMYSAGLPTYCVEVRIVDAEDNEVPRGVSGEIVVRGPNMMIGYWNQPEATARALRGGWMHTGDGGYMDKDGFVYVRDRIKDMIVSGGENVYSAEVEKAVSSHPAIAQCAVIGIPDKKWGEAVHAVVVLKESGHATVEEIIAHCRERIAHYKCPRSVEFRDTLPVTGVGKVQKTALRQPFWENHGRNVS